jgi:uncharacterized protein (DUF2461 family)
MTPRGFEHVTPKQMCLYLQLHHMYVYVYIYYSKNITTSLPKPIC